MTRIGSPSRRNEGSAPQLASGSLMTVATDG